MAQYVALVFLIIILIFRPKRGMSRRFVVIWSIMSIAIMTAGVFISYSVMSEKAADPESGVLAIMFPRVSEFYQNTVQKRDELTADFSEAVEQIKQLQDVLKDSDLDLYLDLYLDLDLD